MQDLAREHARQTDAVERAAAFAAGFDEQGCVRHEWVQSGCCNAALAAGVPDGDRCCYAFCDSVCCGRPLIICGQTIVARAQPRGDWLKTPSLAGALGSELWLGAEQALLSEATRAELGRIWLDDALLEHASIASFARFTLQLLALGAPAALVRAAHAAGLDEIQHAELAFAVASRWAPRAWGPGMLPEVQQELPTDLLQVVVATIVEGCVGETLAALVAMERARVAVDAQIRAALQVIAEDELRHAELAFRFVAWALENAGPTLRAAAQRAFEAALEREFTVPTTTLPEPILHHFGCLSSSEQRQLLSRAVEQVLRPALAALLALRGSELPRNSERAPIG